jgi:hypothetical protein
MMLAFARSRDALSTAGMVLTAAALALQRIARWRAC